MSAAFHPTGAGIQAFTQEITARLTEAGSDFAQLLDVQERVMAVFEAFVESLRDPSTAAGAAYLSIEEIREAGESLLGRVHQQMMPVVPAGLAALTGEGISEQDTELRQARLEQCYGWLEAQIGSFEAQAPSQVRCDACELLLDKVKFRARINGAEELEQKCDALQVRFTAVSKTVYVSRKEVEWKAQMEAIVAELEALEKPGGDEPSKVEVAFTHYKRVKYLADLERLRARVGFDMHAWAVEKLGAQVCHNIENSVYMRTVRLAEWFHDGLVGIGAVLEDLLLSAQNGVVTAEQIEGYQHRVEDFIALLEAQVEAQGLSEIRLERGRTFADWIKEERTGMAQRFTAIIAALRPKVEKEEKKPEEDDIPTANYAPGFGPTSQNPSSDTGSTFTWQWPELPSLSDEQVQVLAAAVSLMVVGALFLRYRPKPKIKPKPDFQIRGPVIVV